jgi:hypothetical protein
VDSRGGRAGGMHVSRVPQRLRHVPRHTPRRADGDAARGDGAGGVGGAVPAAQRIDSDEAGYKVLILHCTARSLSRSLSPSLPPSLSLFSISFSLSLSPSLPPSLSCSRSRRSRLFSCFISFCYLYVSLSFTPSLHPHATLDAMHPSPTQGACLYFSSEIIKLVCVCLSL